MIDNEIFENILSSLADAIILFSQEGKAVWANPAAEQLLGISRQRMDGKQASELFAWAGEVAGEMERVEADGYSLVNHEARFVNQLGAVSLVSVSIYPLELKKGRGLVVILRDLTGLKALERSVMLAEKAEQTATLAAGVAHEIKNPLSGVRGAAQLIQRLGHKNTEEYTGLIIRETDRINNLITDLIHMNEPDIFGKEPVSIYPSLDEAVFSMENQIRQRDIIVHRHYDPSLPMVEGNRDKLVQVFLNLLKNAVEASPDGGGIIVRSGPAWRLPDGAPPRKDKKYATVEIIDEGPGIEETDLSGIFSPFMTRKKEGSGLGLAVTLNLVRAHNGLLTVRNRNEGKGAIAAVYLPFA